MPIGLLEASRPPQLLDAFLVGQLKIETGRKVVGGPAVQQVGLEAELDAAPRYIAQPPMV